MSLRGASIGGGGQLSLGQLKQVQLSGCQVESGDSVLSILGSDGKHRVQLHFEEAADQHSWAQALRDAAGRHGNHGSRQRVSQDCDDEGPVAEDTDEETHLLQTRSRQLQARISSLEDVSKRRDNQLQKMMKRLDGALQMLSAVQDMCSQQKKVIDAQKVAVAELRHDCGMEPARDDATDDPTADHFDGTSAGRRGKSVPAAEEASSVETPGGDDSAEQLLSIMQQLGTMQQALNELGANPAEAKRDAPSSPGKTSPISSRPGNSGSAAAATQAMQSNPLFSAMAAMMAASSPSVSTPSPTTASGAVARAVNHEDDSDDASDAGDGEEDDEATEAALQRLKSLEAEKARFENMLRDSQQEHDDLLKRLGDMRSLMSALGMEDVIGDLGEDAEDDDDS
jgi:molecular chaperone GrpE (heat shock protein)